MVVTQFSFNLLTSSTVKTVHLLGSWDNYTTQVPLSKENISSRTEDWKGTFRLYATNNQRTNRYWYYYIIDGYKVSYDPKQCTVKEPITGQILNVLDASCDEISHNVNLKFDQSRNSLLNSGRYIAGHKSSMEKNLPSPSRRESTRDSPILTVDIPKGRPLSISKIKSPKPITPHATKFILETDYNSPSIDDMTSRFRASAVGNYQCDLLQSPSSSISSSSGCSFSDRSDSDSPSSVSSASSISDYDPSSPSFNNLYEYYGMTRQRERIGLDCSTYRYRYIDDSSFCCSEDKDCTRI